MSLGFKPMSTRERAMADFKRWSCESVNPYMDEYIFNILCDVPFDSEELWQRHQRQYLMSKEVTTA